MTVMCTITFLFSLFLCITEQTMITEADNYIRKVVNTWAVFQTTFCIKQCVSAQIYTVYSYSLIIDTIQFWTNQFLFSQLFATLLPVCISFPLFFIFHHLYMFMCSDSLPIIILSANHQVMTSSNRKGFALVSKSLHGTSKVQGDSRSHICISLSLFLSLIFCPLCSLSLKG